MKINWNPNPFNTTVELDDHDKHNLLIAYQNEQYVNLLYKLERALTKNPNQELSTTLDLIKKWREICDLEVDSDHIKNQIRSLDDIHLGDCTCMACSCSRCYVESLLNINTLPFSKHIASNIFWAFDENKTLKQALDELSKPKQYKKTKEWDHFTQEQFDGFTLRWKSERETAYTELLAYKQEHNF